MVAATCAATSALVALLFSAVPQPIFQNASTSPGEEFDFIVVGGGSGGCVVSSRLSEVSHWKVLLLEAGVDEPVLTAVPAFTNAVLSESELEWSLPTQQSSGLDKGQRITRAKMMGGCSAHNSITFFRGNRKDYDLWESMGARGWGYWDVLPYFKKMENETDLFRNDRFYHGTHGPVSVTRPPYSDDNIEALIAAMQESGMDLVDPNGEHQVGVCYGPQNSRQGQRASSNRAYIEPVRAQRKNLRVVTQALVKKVIINKWTKRAEGVRYVDRDGNVKTALARKEVILSAGVYESPHLLMLSGVGPHEQLREAGIETIVPNPNVGRNIWDHFSSSFSFLVKLTTTARIPNDTQIQQDAQDYLSGFGPFTTQGTNKVTVFMRSPYQPLDDPRPYIQAVVQTGWQSDNLLSQYCQPINSTRCYYNQLSPAVALIHPSTDSYLTLNTTCPECYPLIYQSVFSREVDLKMQAEATWSLYNMYKNSQVLKNIGANVSVADVEACSDLDKESLDFFECAVRNGDSETWGHGVGSCRMGEGRDAVVDSQLRVKGVQGLRVADAAVMPQVTSGNTNAPTMMIGERAADFIKKTWLHSGWRW